MWNTTSFLISNNCKIFTNVQLPKKSVKVSNLIFEITTYVFVSFEFFVKNHCEFACKVF